MKGLFWLVAFGLVLTAAGIVWYVLRKFRERQLAEEARMASFLAATAGKTKPAEALPSPAAVAPAGDGLAQQRLLFEAAHKAGEAGESALAIQLYARLLSRYPASAFAAQARAAVDAQKKKLVKA
jgi:TolA-binding protein